LMNVSPHIKRMNKRKPPKYPELENEVYKWVQELRCNQKPVTRAMIQIKAKALSQKPPYTTYYPSITESKFSNKWVDGFMIRYKLSHR
ncbi:20050_t:CDS:1, partial [Racocetra fulgida]